MIQNTAYRTASGNLQGEDIKMGVADIGHLLNVVTDMYADREAACIREYSTNAWDAHIEAGVTRPIEVDTPTALSPFLSIRDFGVGLSLEDIRTIYSQYGASTKRNTNTQTGMLGLGCKSGLSYSDQFTVTSVKDGIRVQVIVTRDATGASMKVVDTSTTDAGNGTLVQIPAKSYNDFESKAERFFSFWEPGTVILNGKPTEKLPGAKWVTPKIALVEGTTNIIVMGGVPYPASILTGLGYGRSVVGFVDIGEVDFAPSREDLMDTDVTKATVQRVGAEFKAALKASVHADIAQAASANEATQRRRDWLSKVPSQFVVDATWKGKRIPDKIDVPDGTIITEANGYKLSGSSKVNQLIPIDRVNASIWVVGYDRVSFTATHKKKLRKWAEDNGVSTSYFILSKSYPSMEWLDKSKIVKWQPIADIKLPRNAVNPVTGRIPGSYDIWEDGDFNEGVPADDIDATSPIFYTDDKYPTSEVRWLKANVPGSTVVYLTERRVDKFKRHFPKAQPIQQPIQAGFAAWKAGLSKDDLTAWVAQSKAELRIADCVNPAKVDDPDVKNVVALRKKDVRHITEALDGWRRVGMYLTDHGVSILNPFERYDLLPSYYYATKLGDHEYRYMNNEYAYLKSQGKA